MVRIVRQGFTLIELLVVIAIIGLLAVIIINFISPIEMTARARDAGRISGITQLSKAILDYNLNKNNFPAESTWDQDLEDINEVSKFPAGITYVYDTVLPCATNAKPDTKPTYCYSLDYSGANGVIIFSKLESKRNTSLCTPPEEVYVVFSTVDSVTGMICSNGDPVAWPKGSVTYIR